MTRVSTKLFADTAAKQCITDAIMRSSHGIDRCNVDVLKSAYWHDATVDYGVFNGPAMEFCDMLIPGLKAYKVTQHSISNILIELRGNEAKVESYCRAYHYSDDGGSASEMVVGGRYIDRFELRGEEWRVAHRLYVMDWNTNTPASAQWQGGIYDMLKTRGDRYPNDPYDSFMAQ